MASVRITLFDFDPVTGEAKEPIVSELEYDPELTLEEQEYKKLNIWAGDNVSGGSIMVPLGMLTAAMAPVMDADMKRTPSIIMPDRRIIKPN